jgi:hypothetical protein
MDLRFGGYLQTHLIQGECRFMATVFNITLPLNDEFILLLTLVNETTLLISQSRCKLVEFTSVIFGLVYYVSDQHVALSPSKTKKFKPMSWFVTPIWHIGSGKGHELAV